MSNTYDLIANSLNEIISDIENSGGKNLTKETVQIKASGRINKIPLEGILRKPNLLKAKSQRQIIYEVSG